MKVKPTILMQQPIELAVPLLGNPGNIYISVDNAHSCVLRASTLPNEHSGFASFPIMLIIPLSV